MQLPSQSLKSVWSLFVTSCSLPWPWVKVKAPGSWWLVVVGLGDSSGGYSFTTHCAAGLLFDAGVVPLAAEEMSCLLPFPYTPKPNEQHGAHLQHFLHPRYKDLPFPPPGSFLTLAPLCCGRSVSFSSPIFFFLHSSHDPAFKPSIYPTLFSWSLFSQSQRSPQYVASPLWGWQPMTWHGLRG